MNRVARNITGNFEDRHNNEVRWAKYLGFSEQRPVMWTKRPTIPAASTAKAVEALASYAIWH